MKKRNVNIINVIGDLLLVAGFDMGAAGAAFATIAAQGLSVLISFAAIKHRGLPLPFFSVFLDISMDMDTQLL